MSAAVRRTIEGVRQLREVAQRLRAAQDRGIEQGEKYAGEVNDPTTKSLVRESMLLAVLRTESENAALEIDAIIDVYFPTPRRGQG